MSALARISVASFADSKWKAASPPSLKYSILSRVLPQQWKITGASERRWYLQFFAHADPLYRRLAEQWRADQRRQQTRETVSAEVLAATGRNAPCPCGSGKKFKHCCG